MSTEFNYTCNTCGLSFGSAEYQREHMRTDWHRYNLKRRVADLPPIPADVFARKTLQLNESNEEPVNSRRQVTKKDLKRQEKELKRQKNLDARVAKMHLDGKPVFASMSDNPDLNETSASDAATSEVSDGLYSSDVSGTSESESEAFDDVDKLLKQKLKKYQKIPANVSFVDGHVSESIKDNVDYLSNKFGVVFPEEDHINDWEGLIDYLNEKVALGNCCLSCQYMGRSLDAVRAHMIAKQHIKIPWDTEEEQAELLDFYDFSDEENEWEDLEDDGMDSGVETESDVASITSYEEGPYISGCELVLRPGVTAGHRSLNRYFKQRAMTPLEKPGQQAVRLIDYRSPGVTARAADKMLKQSWSTQKKFEQRLIRGRAMQNQQRHFRDQLLQ